MSENKEAFYKKPEECKYSFFQHKECEFFPCHKTDKPEDFNCLFCYCPLYALGKSCGGAFRYTEEGVKDCSGCTFPHRKDNYDRMIARFQDIAALVRLADGKASGEKSD